MRSTDEILGIGSAGDIFENSNETSELPPRRSATRKKKGHLCAVLSAIHNKSSELRCFSRSFYIREKADTTTYHTTDPKQQTVQTDTMLRVGASRTTTPFRRLAKGTVQVVGGSALLGAAGVAVYTSTERGRGLRRELRFWYGVAPVVMDYYWHFASSSPYVKFQRYLLDRRQASTTSTETGNETSTDTDEASQAFKQKQTQKLQDMHQKHAPDILRVLLDLKGLYVKLGQVLSVSALPVPDAYREKFRTLQSDVPGWETFEDNVKPVLEREFKRPVEELFSYVDPIPCGAASIGQAHKAVLLNDSKDQVIVKVQYPDASWQVPADIECVGQFLRVCVFFGVLDESRAKLSFEEFSRQFLSELDYDQERRNLQDIYQSTLDPKAPYQRRGVVVPHVYPEFCTSKIITMSYLPGPKLEEEARRRLEALGIDTKNGLRGVLRAPTNPNTKPIDENSVDQPIETASFRTRVARLGSKLVSIDSLLGSMRWGSQLMLYATAATVKSIQIVQSIPLAGSILVPTGLQNWAKEHSTALQQAKRLSLTKEWIDALFEVHGHQIFNLGCFNADAHPGNILVIDDENGLNGRPKLGLIDFGQCKRLTRQEQAQVARLLVAVANNETDETIAAAFRAMGVVTKNDNTEFLAKFAKLMFGPLQSYHLDRSWHMALHKQDAMTYFPNQLSMVYRTSMLLRGLAISLQLNPSVGDLWKAHAQEAINRFDSSTALREDVTTSTQQPTRRLLRRMTTQAVVEELEKRVIQQK